MFPGEIKKESRLFVLALCHDVQVSTHVQVPVGDGRGYAGAGSLVYTLGGARAARHAAQECASRAEPGCNDPRRVRVRICHRALRWLFCFHFQTQSESLHSR